MAVPKAVERSVAAADAAHAEAYPKPEEQTPDAAAPPASSPQPDVQATSSAPAPASSATTPQSPASSSVDWEQKFKTLQGKYDAEVPRLQRQLNDESSARSRVESLLASIEARQAAPAPAAQPQQQPQQFNVPADMIETYGDDFVNAMRTVARAEAQNLVAPLNTEINNRLGQFQRSLGAQEHHTRVQTYRDFNERLLQLVPDVATLNTNQEFLDWLAQPDPFSGEIRQRLLDVAAQAGNAERVAAFFQTFLREHAAVQPAQVEPETRGQPRRPVTTLETMAAPGRGRASTSAGGTPNGKRHWTDSDITRFYRDKQRGVYKAAEAEALERDLMAAPLEGRYSQV